MVRRRPIVLGAAADAPRSRLARVETALASYVDPQVVRHILSGGDVPLLSGVRRTVTCLFADIRGFTRFAAEADPARVVALLDRFFASACEIAIRHGGSIDKLIGDAIMVLFGVPQRHPDSRRRALAAAIAMVEGFDAAIAGAIPATREGRRPRLGLGIGIATGPVILANVGSTTRMDYTVVGATVNLAARLCAEARASEVLCDVATVRAETKTAGVMIVPTVRSLRLKGVAGAMRAQSFRVAGRMRAASRPDDVDPVCGMKVAATSLHTRRYGGRTYRFCSPGCRARFMRDPATFRVGSGSP
jgi:adenylate cyclase